MNAYHLRALSDAELDDLVLRLARTCSSLSRATTQTGLQAAERYAHALSLVRLEIERRSCD